MTMSDAIYGRAERYVSAARLEAMLGHEYAILLERLGPKRGAETTFSRSATPCAPAAIRTAASAMAGSASVSRKNPGDPPSDITLHVRLLDIRAIDQMEALGMIGVNLIHSAFHHRNHLREFVESLLENLSPGRVEVDLLQVFRPWV
jgi:hypothetical protein